MKTVLRILVLTLSLATPAMAQHEAHRMAGSSPTLGGQYAFATISEIVKILKADSTTDWSKVNLEALRQHLIDMDDVILRAAVTRRTVPGGLQMDITGTGRTAAAIKRMVASHAHVLDEHTDYRPLVKDIAGGVRLTVTARDTTKAATVAMIRGLGFAGIMVEGDHHAEHHLAMARGGGMQHH
ncbi:MAG TPA: hypothetical protein VFO55_00995 [Gemmatimonadaceae bacterium]|nr:hypothetical protein [Gemmatimonadaceae bacterium]